MKLDSLAAGLGHDRDDDRALAGVPVPGWPTPARRAPFTTTEETPS